MLYIANLQASFDARAFTAASGLRPAPLSANDRRRAEAIYALAGQVQAARRPSARRPLRLFGLALSRSARPAVSAASTAPVIH